MPFAGNGQSELYIEDILKMDSKYTPEQGTRVREALMQGRMARDGASTGSISAAIRQNREIDEDVKNILDLRHVWPFRWIIWAWQKLDDLVFKSPDQNQNEKGIQQLIEWFRHMAEQERAQARLELDRMIAKEFSEDARKLKVAKLPFAGKLELALQALKNRDLAAFEMVVDIDRLATNLANAMTKDLNMGSDYMLVALD